MLYIFLLRKTFLMWVFYWKNSASFRFDFPFFPQISIDIDWGQGGRKKCFFTLLKNLFNFVCKKQSRMLTKISVFLNMKFTFLSHFLLRKTQKKYRFFNWKNSAFLIQKCIVFMMHFWELCLMKNALFLKKKWRKNPVFHCVSCDFSRFLQNRKKFTSTKFLAHFEGSPL